MAGAVLAGACAAGVGTGAAVVPVTPGKVVFGAAALAVFLAAVFAGAGGAV